MQPSTVLAAPIPSTSGALVYKQSSDDFVRDVAASLIKKLHEYLLTNVRRFEGLQASIPLLKRAVELYIGREYSASITQSFQAYMFIKALGTSLPPL
ncbi:MAG TPA: hypothetical protein VFV38_34535 [Ktedonobacteraceae bacterium]|nr:hypothetical protein [Ktedonobacteraceae bacterium]